MTTRSCAIPQLDGAGIEAAIADSPFPVFVHFAERDCRDGETARRCVAEVMGLARGRVRCVCVPGARNPQVVSRYGVGKFPTMLVFREGRVVRRLVGHPLPGELEVVLRTELW